MHDNPSMAQLITNLSVLERLIEDGKTIPMNLLDSVQQAKQLAVAIELLGIISYAK